MGDSSVGRDVMGSMASLLDTMSSLPSSLASPPPSPLPPLPHSVLAHGWLPFTIASLLALALSTLFVLWHRSSRAEDRAPGTSLISILGLSLALVASLLVPVDVFLVSYMKDGSGAWKPWADSEEAREALQSSILWCYYSAYGAILAFTFLIIPANFFYHGLPHQDEEGASPSCSAKLCHALKFTLLSLALLAGLVAAGVFLPLSASPPANSTALEEFRWFFEELEQDQGRDLFIFLFNTLSCLGMGALVVYTGWGLVTLPAGLLARRGLRVQLSGVERRVEELEQAVREVQARAVEGHLERFDQSQVDRLEQQVRLLKREQRDLEQRARSFVNRCRQLCRPFQVAIGCLLALLSTLLCLSLLLTNVDKALHSSLAAGFVLTNSSLPNPLDMVLVASQTLFPLDYILYTSLTLFLVCASTSGVQALGVRCCCLALYRVRAWRTPPRGLLAAVLLVMATILAQAVLVFALVPDYTMFGDQYYPTPGGAARCSAASLPAAGGLCVPSRISVLLLALHARTWVFGALYYALCWALLAVVAAGGALSLLKRCRGAAPSEMAEDLLDSEDEEQQPTNPFD